MVNRKRQCLQTKAFAKENCIGPTLFIPTFQLSAILAKVSQDARFQNLSSECEDATAIGVLSAGSLC